MNPRSEDGEFTFKETSESKFYRNFLRKWALFYPLSGEQEVKEDQVEVKVEEEAEIKIEITVEEESSNDQPKPKKIFDYKSKKYIEH